MRKSIVFAMAVFALMAVAPATHAWECEYGEVSGWVKLEGDDEWREATVEDINLKVNEPFWIKIEVVTNIKSNVYIQIFDPGTTKAYRVIGGPSDNGDTIDNYDCQAGWEKTYEWNVCPTGEFVEGTAPLNINVQFNKDYNQYDIIEKTLVHAYISSSEWQDGNGDDGNGGGDGGEGDTPGFGASGGIAAMALVAIVVLYYKRRGHER